MFAGDYEIRLTVSDGRSGAATDFVLITAVSVTTNINPAADAGPDQVVMVDTVVNLDGSSSGDPDGSLLDFDWALAARPANSLVALADANTARPFFVPDQSGEYRIVLTVRDIHGTAASDTLLVTAMPPGGNAPPTADAGKDQIVSAGSVVTLDGRNSRDPEGRPLIFSWILRAPSLSSAILQNADTPTPFFLADKTGEYLARLTVRDDQGQTATDTVLILAR